MVDLIQSGQVWQDGKRNAQRTVPVTLKRAGVADTTGVLATLGTVPVQSLDQAGNIITDRAQDFVIRVADYAFGGTPSAPADHDKIETVVTGSAVLFEVLPIAGEPASRHTDSYGIAWRIHTIQVLS